jgi:hypothetical protein
VTGPNFVFFGLALRSGSRVAASTDPDVEANSASSVETGVPVQVDGHALKPRNLLTCLLLQWLLMLLRLKLLLLLLLMR